jgi:hypothetical protein
MIPCKINSIKLIFFIYLWIINEVIRDTTNSIKVEAFITATLKTKPVTTTTKKLTTTIPKTTTTTTPTSTIPTVISYCSGGFIAGTNGAVSTCKSDAYNKTRQANELDCIFPFYANNILYPSCTMNIKGYYWCSLTRNFTNLFAKCQSNCPLLAQKLVKGQNATHDSCLVIPSNLDIKALPPDQTQIKYILSLHNQIRSNASYKYTFANTTTIYPSATNMRQVYWDISLASLAQVWVEYLAATKTFDHDCNSCRLLLNNQSILIGQNLFAVEYLDYDVVTVWDWAILKGWYNEKPNFLYGAPYGSTTGNFDTVGHYTQLVTSGVSRIGCGVAQINSILYIGCNYANGQTNPSMPYINGTSCSQCGSSQCVNNLCTCNKFCQNYGIILLFIFMF